MNNEIAKIVFDYSKNGRLADNEFINRIVEIVVRENELFDYLQQPVEITKKKGSSSYDLYNNKLSICLNMVKHFMHFYEMPNYYNLFMQCYKYTLLYNLNVVFMIFHELDHTLLKKIGESESRDISAIYYKLLEDDALFKFRSIQDMDISLDEKVKILNSSLDKESNDRIVKYTTRYMLFHDKNPFERRANINAGLSLSNVIDFLNTTSLAGKKLDKISLVKLRQFIKFCRYDYRCNGNMKITNSPSIDYVKSVVPEERLDEIDIYDKDLNTFYSKASSAYTLQERILYGLPLTSEELKAININNNPFGAYQKK